MKLDYEKMADWTPEEWDQHDANELKEKEYDNQQKKLNKVWQLIASEFNLDFTPDEIYVAEFEGDSYYERVKVEYRIGENIYFHEDSHCSCYGFGAWHPEEYPKDVWAARQQRKEAIA